MTRLAITTAVLLGCVASAPAAFTTQTTTPSEKTFPAAVRKAVADTPRQTVTATPQSGVSITNETEILLDGQACQYGQVPANAVIRLLELSTDRRTVLRIHFGSTK